MARLPVPTAGSVQMQKEPCSLMVYDSVRRGITALSPQQLRRQDARPEAAF